MQSTMKFTGMQKETAILQLDCQTQDNDDNIFARCQALSHNTNNFYIQYTHDFRKTEDIKKRHFQFAL